jgi:hypothetical protein
MWFGGFASVLEVLNALVITYFGTEVLLKDQLRYDRPGEREREGAQSLSAAKKKRRKRQAQLTLGALWGLANLYNVASKFLGHAEGGGKGSDSKGSGFAFHLPSSFVLLLVVVAFTALAWWDVRRARPDLTPRVFARQIGVSTLESLILLPVASMAVALGFLVLIGALDALHSSTVWLNSPIYYGVLYGPFSTIYFFTKRRCITNRAQILPL